MVLLLAVLAAACGDSAAEPATTSQATTADTGSPEPAPTLDVQGHRGARGLKPENTLPAFETALDLEVTTLELDLHFSADDQVVVWHDPVIGTDKCEGTVVGTAVRALTSAELAGLRCDRNPDPDSFPRQIASATALAGDDYRIVTLAELFEFVGSYAASDTKTESQRANAATVQFNIETKRKVDDSAAIGDGFDGTNPGPFELAILDVVGELGFADRVTVQSFDHRSLWAIHAIAPDVRLAALTSRRLPDFADLAARGAVIWSPRFQDLSPGTIEGAHSAGLSVIPWTVNDPTDMAQLVARGVDGLITDRPDLVPAG